ncbi:Ig-like domain-containing protein [Mycobacterium sp. CVI_P3]|uniref:Ig-like domain-containing protein n=1 Tax=Mycobacterium pinniadriaticum TaxID=2994102 RepID=A0ABT3SK21_9MYCO|nr:Ig-like domain-containing protein [Mycobacterium pinniadriaticum]MCX2933295.1 Ig-like domain-containing protein [Mycobacterium pinniadriaticum]MCX2939717.1 Ig-like domain-containing protein [Mycobacterium pinniadriaticum]
MAPTAVGRTGMTEPITGQVVSSGRSTPPAAAAASGTSARPATSTVPTAVRSYPAPATLHAMVTEALTWAGLTTPAPRFPIPDTPIADQIAGLWVGVRRLQYTLFNSYPSLHPSEPVEDPDTGVITGNLGGTDADGDPLTYTVTNATHGSVAISTDGSYVYTPEPGFAHTGGTDSFSVSDTTGTPWHVYGLAGIVRLLADHLALLGLPTRDPATATVNLTVAPVNHAPTLTIEVGEPDPTTGAVLITAHTADADGDPVTVAVSGGASSETDANMAGAAAVALLAAATTGTTASGSVVDNGDGTLTYTPTGSARVDAAGTPGVDTDLLTVTASDGQGGTTSTQVAVPIDPIGATLLGTVALSGGDVTYGPGGTVYQTSTTAEGTTRVVVITAADPTNPTTLALPGTPYAGLVIGPDGTAYQTTSATIDGQLSTYVTQISGTTATTTPAFAGGPTGAPVLGSDGVAYQTTAMTFDGQTSTSVIVVLPPDPANIFSSGVPNSTASGASGSPVGGVVFGPDGTAYQQLAVTSASGEPATAFLLIKMYNDGSGSSYSYLDSVTATFTLPGVMPADAVLLFGPDGTAYAYTDTSLTLITPGNTSSDFPTSNTPVTTGVFVGGAYFAPDGTAYQPYRTTDGTDQVLVIDPAHPANVVPVDVPGYGFLVVGPDGTAYHTADTGTTVTVIDPSDPAHPTTLALAGPAGGGVIIGSDGTAYQPATFENPDGSTNTQVLVIDPSDPANATSVIHYGTSVDLAVGPDGRAYQVTVIVPSNNFDAERNKFIVNDELYPGLVDGSGILGEVYSVAIAGTPNFGSGPIPLAAGDYVYYNGSTWEKLDITGQAGDPISQVVVIDPANPALLNLASNLGNSVVFTHGILYLQGGNQVVVAQPVGTISATTLDIAGYAWPLVVGSDGVGYQTSGGADSSNVMLINPADPANVTTLTVAGPANDGVVIGPDGTVYQRTDGLVNGSPGSHVLVFNPTDLATATIVDVPGDPANSGLVFGPDGTAYLATTTNLLVIDPTDQASASSVAFTGTPVGGLVFDSDGTAYQTGTDGDTTYVTVIDPSDAANPTTVQLAGVAEGSVVLGSGGVVFQLVNTGSSTSPIYTLSTLKVASSAATIAT